MAKTADFDAVMRGPDAYKVAAKALEAMTRHKVWPTPVNYEVWLLAAANPSSPLSAEIERIAAAGEPFTDSVCSQLAAAHLPGAQSNEAIREAGDKLTRELDTVSQAIEAAHLSTETYGGVLADAGAELEASNPAQLRHLVSGLADATRQAELQSKVLQRRLEESTAEIVKLKDSLAEVRRDATVDALTGLGNRRAFDAKLAEAVAACEDAAAPMCLAIVDIDHFKRFNDTWGHQTGDQVLRFVGSVIGAMSPAPRFAARYGGEEFALVFSGENARTAESVLRDILKEISSRALRRRSTNEGLGTITVSAGLAELNGKEGASALLERADAALYAAKQSGRNRVTNAGKKAVEAAA